MTLTYIDMVCDFLPELSVKVASMLKTLIRMGTIVKPSSQLLNTTGGGRLDVLLHVYIIMLVCVSAREFNILLVSVNGLLFSLVCFEKNSTFWRMS